MFKKRPLPQSAPAEGDLCSCPILCLQGHARMPICSWSQHRKSHLFESVPRAASTSPCDVVPAARPRAIPPSSGKCRLFSRECEGMVRRFLSNAWRDRHCFCRMVRRAQRRSGLSCLQAHAIMEKVAAPRRERRAGIVAGKTGVIIHFWIIPSVPSKEWRVALNLQTPPFDVSDHANFASVARPYSEREWSLSKVRRVFL